MVCLPEHFAYITHETVSSQGKIYDFSDRLDAALFKRYRQLALDNQVWLSLGCFPEFHPETGNLYLTHSIVDYEGNVVAKYRKMHMFDVDLDRSGGVT